MTRKQAYKTEVYYRGRSVFKAGYHRSREDAARSAVESLEHGGKAIYAFKKEDT